MDFQHAKTKIEYCHAHGAGRSTKVKAILCQNSVVYRVSFLLRDQQTSCFILAAMQPLFSADGSITPVGRFSQNENS